MYLTLIDLQLIINDFYTITNLLLLFCLCFEFNPTPELQFERTFMNCSSITINVTYFGPQCGAHSQSREGKRKDQQNSEALLIKHQTVYKRMTSHDQSSEASELADIHIICETDYPVGGQLDNCCGPSG